MSFSRFTAATTAQPEEVQPEELMAIEYAIEFIKTHYDLMFWFVFTVPIFLVMATICGAVTIEYLMDGRKKTLAGELALYHSLPQGRKFYTVWIVFLLFATVVAFFAGLQVFWWSEWWKDV